VVDIAQLFAQLSAQLSAQLLRRLAFNALPRAPLQPAESVFYHGHLRTIIFPSYGSRCGFAAVLASSEAAADAAAPRIQDDMSSVAPFNSGRLRFAGVCLEEVLAQLFAMRFN
jgi:hypothetical protein